MRFKARLSGPLDWTVTVTDAGRATRVAERTGTGDRISWFWDSSQVEPGRYTWTMEADGVRPAGGVLGGVDRPSHRRVRPRGRRWRRISGRSRASSRPTATATRIC